MKQTLKDVLWMLAVAFGIWCLHLAYRETRAFEPNELAIGVTIALGIPSLLYGARGVYHWFVRTPR